ncbi:MAG: TIGR01777 family oxidoreductase [Vicingaceae bacterium]
MKKKVLISGGSGLLGKRLSQMLKQRDYSVSHLSRSKTSSMEGVSVIQWDVKNQKLEAEKIKDFDHIIHLAGAGIVDEPWTDKRKKIIEESRTKSAELLVKAVAANTQKPISFVSASAVGYYGFRTLEKEFHEEDQAGHDFLADTCVAWEKSVDVMKELDIPTAKIRIGIILSDKGGALAEMAKPVKMGFGAPLGSGKQYMPWIHIDDLCRIFIQAMEEKWEGAFNGGAPKQVNNKEFTKTLAKVLHKPLWLPNLPAFVMKVILGKRALLVLEGSRVSTEKVKKKGFEFTYPELESALKEIYF